MRTILLPTILLLPLTGCAQHGLPATRKIQFIHIVASRLPDEKEHAVKLLTATLLERKDIVAVMDWLHTVDWWQSQDLTAIRLPAPDGHIILTLGEGSTCAFAYYWDGKLVVMQGDRLHQTSDMEKWQQIATRVASSR